MKNKSAGLIIGKIFTVVLCLIAAIIFWLLVKYSSFGCADAIASAVDVARGYLTI